MAKNQVFKFVDVLSVPVPEGTKSGDPVVLDADAGLVGVAETDRGEAGTATGPNLVSSISTYNGGNLNGYASVSFKGAYALEVTGDLAPLDAVYINSSGALTATAGTNVRFGWSLTTKGAGAGLATVVIDGAPAATVAP